jgi:hypothetical protein
VRHCPTDMSIQSEDWHRLMQLGLNLPAKT